METDVRVVLVTAPDEEQSVRMAKVLLEERLVACVNVVGGVRSLYRWKNDMCDDPEVLLIMKTSEAKADALADRVAELHPYEVPEVLMLPVAGGSQPYLDWVRDETQRGEAG